MSAILRGTQRRTARLSTRCGGEGSGVPGPCPTAKPADEKPSGKVKPSAEHQEALKAVQEAMPADARKLVKENVKSVSVFATKEALTEHALARSPEKLQDMRDRGKVMGGGYVMKTGELMVDGPVKAGISLRECFAHEMTHAIDGRDPETRISSSSDWQQAHKDELAGGKLSAYGASKATEGFAEFGRVLYGTNADRDALAQQFPKCAAVFKAKGLWPSDSKKDAGSVSLPMADAFDEPVEWDGGIGDAVAADGSNDWPLAKCGGEGSGVPGPCPGGGAGDQTGDRQALVKEGESTAAKFIAKYKAELAKIKDAPGPVSTVEDDALEAARDAEDQADQKLDADKEARQEKWDAEDERIGEQREKEDNERYDRHSAEDDARNAGHEQQSADLEAKQSAERDKAEADGATEEQLDAMDARHYEEDQALSRQQIEEDHAAGERQDKENADIESAREKEDAATEKARAKEEKESPQPLTGDQFDKVLERRGKEDDKIEATREKEDAKTEKAREQAQEKLEASREKEDAAKEAKREKEDAALEKSREKEDAKINADRLREDDATGARRAKEDGKSFRSNRKCGGPGSGVPGPCPADGGGGAGSGDGDKPAGDGEEDQNEPLDREEFEIGEDAENILDTFAGHLESDDDRTDSQLNEVADQVEDGTFDVEYDDDTEGPDLDAVREASDDVEQLAVENLEGTADKLIEEITEQLYGELSPEEGDEDFDESWAKHDLEFTEQINSLREDYANEISVLKDCVDDLAIYTLRGETEKAAAKRTEIDNAGKTIGQAREKFMKGAERATQVLVARALEDHDTLERLGKKATNERYHAVS